jgi:leucyl aminopeptidase
MSVNIKFKKNFTIKVSNLSFFIKKDDDLKFLSKYLSIKNDDVIFKEIKNFFYNKDQNIILLTTNNKKIVFIKISNNLSILNIEKLGSEYLDFLKKYNLFNNNFFSSNIAKNFKDQSDFVNYFLHSIKVKSYIFDKYKSKKNKELVDLNIFNETKNFKLNSSKSDAILKGLEITKDLVSEPGNILHPDEYVNRLRKLKSVGLKVTILNKKKLKKIGMNALLGVGQGSIKGSYLAILEWRGLKTKKKPLAFVGKGVCFDTGGISLKPAKFMEDMTYDMAGSAVVVGLMKTLALRKAKINAVGVVGLVENMPDGNAQRPGDIVKSYSGKTIEILNTDAEGRLVLADALTYTEKKFKPKFIVDLATLTGAIIVSLGSEYAGLFSNDDKISDQLSKAGDKVGEKVWRMPLNDDYDKLIDSKKADMQNINYVGGAGATTAAQFLQRFILNKTPWAHLDIAGMAFSKYGGSLNSSGATGYGVRLLNQLIEDNYE